MKEGMLFSMKIMAGEYVNTAGILDSLKTVYEAKLEYGDF